MNNHNHNHNNGEPRLDETPAVAIISVSYCIGRMDVPIRRGTYPPFRSTGSLPEHGSIAIEQQMNSKIGETGNFTRRTRDRMPDFAYMIISLLHANPILPIFRSPERLLAATGLGAGQSVPEVGGELHGYSEMLADAVVNVRFTASHTMAGAAELLAYGTAVRLRKL